MNQVYRKKVSKEGIKEIKRLNKSGVSMKKLAKKYKVHEVTIGRYINQ
jgi:hypothetical protein